MADSISCKLNRTWVLKMTVFLVVLLAFGFWALYDAAILYPNRGLQFASYQLKEYLAAADKAGFLRSDRIASADPAADLSALSARLSDLRSAAAKDSSSQESRTATMDLARYEWLSALERCWKLTPSAKPLGEIMSPSKRTLWVDVAKGDGYSTSMDGTHAPLSVQALYNDLLAYWSGARPTPLSAFDLPVQWLFVAVGFGLGAYLIFLLVRCKTQAIRTRFEPETQRLSLPSGASFVPADLEDLDKRLWHKYFVIAILKDSSQHKLDLLRYVPLEDWVLEMEKTRFPERAAEEAAAKKAAEEEAPTEPTPTT